MSGKKYQAKKITGKIISGKKVNLCQSHFTTDITAMCWVCSRWAPLQTETIYNSKQYFGAFDLRGLCLTGVCGGIYYEGIYMVKVILAEIYMLEHFL